MMENKSEGLEVLKVQFEHLRKQQEDHNVTCNERHRQLRQDMGVIHGRMDTILQKLDSVVLLDQKITTVANHVENLEKQVEDYQTVREKANFSDKSLKALGAFFVVGILGSLFALILK